VPSPSLSAPAAFLYADHEGAVALVHAYRTNGRDEVRFLSVGGAAEVVKAVLSGLRISRTLTLIERTEETDPRRPSRRLVGSLTLAEDSPTRQLIRRLPCGAAHGILYPDPAATGTPQQFTLILPESQRANAPRLLLRYIDHRTTLPLHPSWADWLWRLFDDEAYLEPLQGTGSWIGWDVSWSDAVLRDRLTEAIKKRALTVA
jgi:hypothetical protein